MEKSGIRGKASKRKGCADIGEIIAALIEKDKIKAFFRRVAQFVRTNKAAVVTATVIALSLTAWSCWRVFHEEPEHLSPDENPKLHIDMGDRYFELELFDKALPEYQNAADIEPGEALNHDSQARALAALGRYEEALDESILAVALAPNVAQYHYNEGTTLYYLERYSGAKKEFEAAIRLQPNQASYHDGLGSALDKRKSLQCLLVRLDFFRILFFVAARFFTCDVQTFQGLADSLIATAKLVRYFLLRRA